MSTAATVTVTLPPVAEEMVTSVNVSDKRKVPKTYIEDGITIVREPCPTWCYLGLGIKVPREEGFNLTLIKPHPQHLWMNTKVKLMKVNYCCGMVEMGQFSMPFTGNRIETDSIPLIKKTLQKAKEWGKGLVSITCTDQTQVDFFKKHFNFRQTANFINPNSGVTLWHMIHLIGDCEIKENN